MPWLILELIAALLMTSQPLTAVRLVRDRGHGAALGVKRRPSDEARLRRAIARAMDGCDARAFERVGKRRLPDPAQVNLEARGRIN
jgi:hypothetical protein